MVTEREREREVCAVFSTTICLSAGEQARPCRELRFKRDPVSEYDLAVTASTNTSESCQNNEIFCLARWWNCRGAASGEIYTAI